VRHRRADKGHAAELTHFADAVLGKAPPQTTHLDGIRATICCLKLLDSVKSGQPQEIDLSGFYAAIEQTRP
jgi:predicted dehydrogenase